MSEDYLDTLDRLRRLMLACRSDAWGFHAVSKYLRDREVRSTLEWMSGRHHQMADELKQIIRRLGGNPKLSRNAIDHASQEWSSLKSAVREEDDLQILEACKQREKSTYHIYVNVVRDQSLPLDARAAVQQLYDELSEGEAVLSALCQGVGA